MKVKIGPYKKDCEGVKCKVKLHRHDMFNLDYTLSLVILPALKRFRKLRRTPGRMSVEEWNSILDKMIDAFDIIANGKCWPNEEEEIRVRKGLKLFAKWYTTLWT